MPAEILLAWDPVCMRNVYHLQPCVCLQRCVGSNPTWGSSLFHSKEESEPSQVVVCCLALYWIGLRFNHVMRIFFSCNALIQSVAYPAAQTVLGEALLKCFLSTSAAHVHTGSHAVNSMEIQEKSKTLSA